MLLCFLMAWLAYSLCFLFTVVNGASASWYVEGIIMHLPFWFFAMLIGGLITKLQIPRRVTFALEGLLIALLLLPLVYKPSGGLRDLYEVAFYITDYLLCLALLKKLRARIIKP